MDAYFKTEIIDAYCRILILTKQIGRVNYYDDAKAAELIKIKPNLGIRDVRLEKGLENCDLCGNSLFREGYTDFKPEHQAFIPAKFQQAAVPAESKYVTPPTGGDPMDAMVQTITDQVMKFMNGSASGSA